MTDHCELMPKFSPGQIDAYLERISYQGSRDASRETLDDLIWQHQLTVPFETLDCHDFRIGADLTPDRLFDKIVTRRRGGHCLELNGCFYRLLLSLGFQVRPCLNRVILGEDDFTHPIDHRTTLVELDGHTLFCDVGLGGPMPSSALDIDAEGWQQLRADTFQVRPSRFEGWYEICRKTPKGNHYAGTPDAMRIELLFTRIRCFETDYLFLNNYMSFHPEALHTTNRILNLRTADGYKTIMNDWYREIQNDETKEEFRIGENLNGVLRERFGIVL